MIQDFVDVSVSYKDPMSKSRPQTSGASNFKTGTIKQQDFKLSKAPQSKSKGIITIDRNSQRKHIAGTENKSFLGISSKMRRNLGQCQSQISTSLNTRQSHKKQ